MLGLSNLRAALRHQKGGVEPPSGNVGVNKQPVGDGGPQKLVPQACIQFFQVIQLASIHLLRSINLAPAARSGEKIYAKSGTVKPPVVTTSPIGVTTTTVYDANGNSTSTNTDPKGNILSKTRTMFDQTGASMSTTTDAEGKDLKHNDQNAGQQRRLYLCYQGQEGKVSSSAVYDSTGKIVSQSAKIITSTTGTGGTYSTGKGHKEGFLGEGSQKYKEKAMNELLHEDKQNLNSSPAQVILRAGISRRKLLALSSCGLLSFENRHLLLLRHPILGQGIMLT